MGSDRKDSAMSTPLGKPKTKGLVDIVGQTPKTGQSTVYVEGSRESERSFDQTMETKFNVTNSFSPGVEGSSGPRC